MRSSPPRRVSRLRAVSPKRAVQNRSPGIPARVRSEVRERAGGYCEVCTRPGPTHIHHRKLRSQGGKHEVANLLHIHTICHHEIHAYPARAYDRGWLVHGWNDPAAVPVQIEPRLGRVS